MEATSTRSPGASIERVPLPAFSPDPYRSFDPEGYDRAERLFGRLRGRFRGRTVSSVTYQTGGGLTDMLSSVLPYVRKGGIDAQWLRLIADADLRKVTRRLYNNLYGSAGDGGPLGEDERAALAQVGAAGDELVAGIRGGDVVVLHDPPTVALVEPAREAGALVIWRCHLGVDVPNEHARRAQEFLLPFVTEADAYAFTQRQYAWQQLDQDKVFTIPPSLDPLSTRNRELSPEAVLAILDRIGLTDSGSRAAPTFTRPDGSPQRVDRRAVIDQDVALPDGAPVVAQVSSWEQLKDQSGTLDAFTTHCDDPEAHLVLVGPDDEGRPEERAVLEELRRRREGVPAAVRERVHLLSLPVDDRDENAAMVNAIQRRADVIVQKSLAEGFGLSVTEAMWKEKPVIAAQVGGMKDQILDGESGVLIEDPRDLEAFGKAMAALLRDPERRRALGVAAKASVQKGYLTPSHVARYLELIERVAG
jgi:trehalose synthase